MTDLVLGHDQSVAEWASRQFGSPFVPPFVAWGVIDSAGELTGALVFNEWMRGGNISLSLVGSNAIRRGIMRQAARYVFLQLGCSRVTARTRRSNVRTRKILQRSWRFEAVAKRWFGPTKADDAMVYFLLREDAEKWLR